MDKSEKTPKTIDMHYLKTSNYRTYYVDGIFGGVTGHAKIYMELFLERAVTPQIMTYDIKEDGQLGDEISRTGKKGLIREVEAGVIMDIEVAKIMRDWLDDKIKLFEKQVEEILERQKGKK